MTHQSAITSLDTRDPVHVETLGAKARNIIRLAEAGLNVPRGFLLDVDTVTAVASRTLPLTKLKILQQRFDELVATSSSNRVIVRSSSDLEDRANHQYFGLFKSVDNITDFDQFIYAIERAHGAAHSPALAEYSLRLGVDLPQQHLGLIVQEFINCEYSAIAVVDNRTCSVEAFHGSLGAPIAGSGVPLAFQVVDGDCRLLGHPTSDWAPETVRRLASQVEDLATLLRDQWRKPFMIEVGFQADICFVFQIRELVHARHSAADAPIRLSAPVSLPGQKELGTKGAAMKLFYERGLFPAPMTILKPQAPLEFLVAELKADAWRKGPYTVRFSHKSDLGLPRAFVNSTDEILEAVEKLRRPSWATIVHGYFEVQRSFELLLFSDGFLLEHVPGMWESDNRLLPDVVEVRGNHLRGWLCDKPRLATFARAGKPEQLPVDHLSFELPIAWAKRLRSVLEAIGPAVHGSGANVHFVEDSDGQWRFLNVRPGYAISPPTPVSMPLHIVSCADDMSTWDGQSSILLRIFTDRGREHEILALVDVLPQDKRDIFVECGILSHPAMVLREHGIQVVPAYLAYPPLQNDLSYREIEVMLDTGTDPIGRIMREPTCYADGYIRVVRDADPIVDGHLLVVANTAAPSFADVGEFAILDAALHAPSTERSAIGRRRIFVERGRATFCTSGFASTHAHGHLLPLDSLVPSVIDDLASATRARQYPSFCEALKAASRLQGEYLLFGTSDGPAYIAGPKGGTTHEKRFIRTFLSGRLKREGI